MFMSSAKQIWEHLERRFAITNGARKKLVSDYYTDMRALWEELESLTLLSAITEMSSEFLNGLDEIYGPQRSQILLMSPLPTVNEACNLIQQEESQREIFRQTTKQETGIMAMYGKKGDLKCSNCGKTGHTVEKCWDVRSNRGKDKNVMNRPQQYKNKEGTTKHQSVRINQKWDKSKESGKKVAANVKVKKEGNTSNSNNNVVSPEQLEQLLKMLPSLSKGGCGVGQARLEMGLCLNKVMLIPNFKHNLLCIQKLSKESNCQVVFQPQYCLIHHRETKEVKGIGKAKNDLYYLIDLPLRQAVERLASEIQQQKTSEDKQAIAVEMTVK
ncbi:Intracisternal A-particle Gag-related polyprotein [Bienertia sinuspersici]